MPTSHTQILLTRFLVGFWVSPKSNSYTLLVILHHHVLDLLTFPKDHFDYFQNLVLVMTLILVCVPYLKIIYKLEIWI